MPRLVVAGQPASVGCRQARTSTVRKNATNRSRVLVDLVLTRYDIGIDIATARGATYTVPLRCGPSADAVLRLLRISTPPWPKSTAAERDLLETFVSVMGAEKDQQQTVMSTRRRRTGVLRPVPRTGRITALAARVDLASFLSHCPTRARPPRRRVPTIPPGGGHDRGHHAQRW